MHRRIFVFFGFSIMVTMLAVSSVVWRGCGKSPAEMAGAIERYAGAYLATVWDSAAERQALANELAEVFDVAVVIVDRDGRELHTAGGSCAEPDHVAVVTRDGERLGEARACGELGPSRRTFFIALFVGGFILWGAAGAIARRLVRPLVEVSEVARSIGDGDYASRVRFGRRAPGEIGDLADAINDMAERIEKQMADQRALLAAVSHELRTPLGHMRVIAELAQGGDTERLAELEQELAAVDTLVDQLLASSRLEFETLEMRPLDAVDVCVRALERADIDAGVLEVEASDTAIEGDAMLLSRAVGNLLENASRHADKVLEVRVEGDDRAVVIAVRDHGPGFAAADLDRVFETFYRGEHRAKASHGSLGLGLALVKRIAEAHGGRARARNVDGGAEVVIEMPRPRA